MAKDQVTKNPYRGETMIQLKDQEFKTKLNLESIVRIESACNQSVVAIAQLLANGNLRTDQIVIILTQAIRGGGNDLTKKDVEALIWESGLVESMKACAEILRVALGVDESGNVEGAGSE